MTTIVLQLLAGVVTWSMLAWEYHLQTRDERIMARYIAEVMK